MNMERKILDVSQVNEYIKNLMDGDELLAGLCIRGELSNYKIYPSGHHYFTLKDAGGALRCVMFRSSAARLRFRPENGMKVLAMGRITVFPRDGAYQLYCSDLTPHRIAIITSGAGAAIMDMLRILGKRYPLSKVVILPVRVQGAEAPAEIAGAIRYANKYQVADVIITGRGGGSMEDLWAFNDERVARAIFASEIPVVSAVGHEPDVTISDFVADVRAATPSNAAELVAPDQNDLRAYLLSAQTRMAQAMQKRLKLDRKTLDGLKNRRVLQSPINYVNEKRLLLDHSAQRLGAAAQRNLAGQKQRFIHLTAKLDALSPLKVLARGYSVVLTPDGRVVQRAAQVQIGEQVDIKLHQGSLTASVTQIQEERNGEEITEL